MDIKEFLDQEEIKKLIANDDLDAVYKSYDQNYGAGYKISEYLLDREINPVDYFKESIPDYALLGCNKLTDITIPASVTTIGEGAFFGCGKLMQAIILNGVIEIAAFVFKNCKKLKSVTIPNSVTKISNGVFFNCSELENITIPDSLIAVGAYLFEGCGKLTNLQYKGTKEQWEKIEKPQSWRYGSFIKVIHCIDGDISL